MADFSIIQNSKLRDLISKSQKFASLDSQDQNAHLKRISEMSAEQQTELIEFFTNENQQEEKEQLKVLKEFYNKIVDLEQKFTRLLKADPEKKERQKENHEMKDLLNKLDSIN